MRRYSALLAALLLPGLATAQQDTTPPVLVDYTISPVAFDTGGSDVALDVCATTQDDLSGVEFIRTIIRELNWNPILSQGTVINGGVSESVCYQVVLPQFSPQGDYLLEAVVRDNVDNERTYAHPLLGGLNPNLCNVGTCELSNRPFGPLPDGDGDSVPDDADNCPADPNPGQEDTDLDLVGDACDPFPNNRDNEQAQCDADLLQCLATGFADEDSDGKPDSVDTCPGTPTAEAVDSDGCSLAQFCARFSVVDTTRERRACKKADWDNDEPLMRMSERDCAIDKGAKGRQDDLCVPSGNP